LTITTYLVFFGVGLVSALCLTPLARRLAVSTGRVAVPRDTRWHKKETALLGGVAIFASTLLPWIFGSIYLDWEQFGRPFLPLVLCASGMFLVGLTDDIFNMDPQHKLVAQVILASILIYFGLRVDWTFSRTLNLFITLFWIVGITNAFNLLDNMDGLAAGVAFIGGTFLFLTHFLNPTGSPAGALLLAVIHLGALLGFLIYNFNPASIFMGDAGSLFIGFLMAGLTIAGNGQKTAGGSMGHLLSVIAIPILILFIPILDTGFVSVMRKLFRRPISQGGRDHSSHRLVAIGLSERRAVLVLYAFSVASGLIALSIYSLSIGATLVFIVLYLLFVIFFWIYLAKVKVYEEESIFQEKAAGMITPIIVRITYRRRLLEVLLDVVLISMAYYVAYLLRFEGPVYYLIGENFEFFMKSVPIVVSCQIFCFFLIGVYRGVWESTGLSDLIDYIKAVTAGTILSVLVILAVYRFHSFSRVVFVLYWMLLLLLISLSRLSFRLVDEGTKKGKQKGKPTLIYGAGVGGQMVVKEIENNRSLQLVLVGFIDDNPMKRKRKIMGYPVLGTREDLERLIRKNNIQEIIVSFRENGDVRKKELHDLCQKKGLEVEVKQMKMVLA